MNTLTPNRIIQKGDEYRQNGTWKPVPKDDYGLQVMFTKYAEVRRPDEPEHKSRGTGDTLPNPPPIETVAPCFPDKATQEAHHAEAYLPTVVSKKAHKALRETPETDNDSRTEVPKRVASPTPTAKSDRELINSVPGSAPITPEIQAALDREVERQPKLKPVTSPLNTEIPFSPTDPPCIWIGRNGTFRQQGVNIYAHNSGKVIKIVPTGKRGAAKNAQIEFPASAIPQIIDFLNKHNKTPK